MKKTSILLLLLSLSLQFILAQQPTQAELDKMMKQAQGQMKKYGNDSTVNSVMKGLQDQQKKVSDAMKNQPANNKGVTNGSLYADPSDYGNVDNWKFPAKNTALLSSLPKKVFTKPELVSFLNDIYSQLSKKLPAGISSSVQSIAAKYNNDGNKMGDAAIVGWYTNYREESLLLIIKAAANSPDNGLLLNNCAAILNMGGIEQKAIPILKYILQSYPGSSMVLNNLGQAYAGLGETDTAMVYLGRCIKIEPENPEANNTAGQIEATKGNTEKAISYFEQSIKGAYNKPAELKLSKLKKSSSIVPFVRPRVKLPEYFNQFKYKFPAQCTSVDNATTVEAEYIAFRNTVSDQQVNYLRKLNAANINFSQNLPPGRIVKKDEFIAQPFHELCSIMARDVLKAFSVDVVSYDKKYYADIATLENEYQEKFQIIKKDYVEREKAARKAGCCGEGNTSCCVPDGEECKALNALANQYLPKFAVITEDWQEKNMVVLKKYFDELLYWGYLEFHPYGEANFLVQCFYPAITQYLGMLVKAGITRIIKPCIYEPPTSSSFDSIAIKEMECPLDIVIPLLAGKIQLNCDKFSVSGGEGAVFSYERNFKTHQSTLSAGIGLTLELTAKAGPVKAGVSATATETAFITFDGNNGIADFGLKNEAKVSAGATGVGKKEVSIGSTFGIHSGCNFNEGPFKGMIGPAPEVPLNKNVKIYKPNQP
jgi:tetratricopeptide (TPR) repeat protein